MNVMHLVLGDWVSIKLMMLNMQYVTISMYLLDSISSFIK